MRFSACATFAVALLATDASAQRYRQRPSSWSWSWSSGSKAPSNGNNKVVHTVIETVYVRPTSVPVAAPEVPAAAPTTLVQITTPAPAATNAPSPGSGNLGGDQQKALDAHNAARAEVGTADLVWDDALASAAQQWADHLTSVGSLTHSSGTGQGENLYMQSGRGDTPFVSASDMWIAEKADYSGQRVGDGNFAAYGHYTQAVWKSTTKVGMASATDSSGRTYVVARYSPPGNM